MLTKIGLDNITDCLGYRLIVKSVERVADHATKIAQTVLQIENKIDKDIVNKLEELSIFSLEVFEESSKALFKEDYTTSNQIVEKAKSIEKREKNLTNLLKNKKDVKEQNSINLIIEHIRRTAEYSSDIAEIILNMTAEKFLDKTN
jgi:phosphate uptake regulator